MSPSGRSFHWLDVERIAEELADRHPALRPLEVRFPALRDLVKALPGFVEQPGHAVNEKILEAIQMRWLEETEGQASGDDD